MRTKRRKWRARRALSVWLACLMLASSVSLPVQAAEPQVASGERLEDAQVNPEGSESDAAGESEGPEEETGAQESSETDITEQPSDAADSDGEDQQPGAEEEGQPENPDEEDDEDQSGNPGTENGGEQPDDPETPGENDQTDTEDGENQKDTEEMPEDSEDEEKNPVKAPLGEEDADKTELTPFGITVEDKVYDGEAAAYTGTLMLKAPDGNEYVASLDYGFSVPPSYEGILADGSVYENTGSAPSEVGEYTLTFSRIYGGNSLYYKLKETVYRFKITPREVTVTADSVTVPVGGELPALSELTYHTDGLVKEDTLLTPPSLRYSPEEIPTDAEGSYEIVPSGADAGANYSITYVNGTLKVGAGEVLYSGTTNKISWQIDHGGKLTIEGTGDYEGRPWLEYRDAIKYAEVEVTGITTTRDMFNGCSSLRSLDVSGLDTGNVTNMQSMFNGCSSLQSLDVSGFNTSNVTGEQYSGGGWYGVHVQWVQQSGGPRFERMGWTPRMPI